MDDRSQHEGHSVQQSLPADPDVETRDDTIARLAGSDEAVGRELGGSPDPSTRRGVNRVLWRTRLMAGAIGFVVGAVAALILSLAPGPFETDGVTEMIGYMALLGFAVGVVSAMVFALLTLAREDGRVEREVERRTGHGPEGPGQPNSPETDLEPR